MPFFNTFDDTSLSPHLLSKLDRSSKLVYKKRYKALKTKISAGLLVGVGTSEGVQLAKDAISSKLKAYGYKSLFAITLGPIIQFVSLPLYVFTYGSKFRNIAISFSEVGAKITKGEMGIVNWAWIGVDLALFGEPITIMDDSTLMILRNETDGDLKHLVEELGGEDG